MGEEKVAFISDVHANVEALAAVLADARGLPVFCCGDVVGYGASPNEVVRLLREAGAVCVLGNHDVASLTGRIGGLGPAAGVAAAWTNGQLSPESRAFLGALPRRFSGVVVGGKRVYMAHGSPEDELWEYVTPSTHSDLFEYYLSKVGADIIALGHTHEPFVWHGEAGGTVFNPGSVGRPAGGEPLAAYAVVGVGRDGVTVVEPRTVRYVAGGGAAKASWSGLPRASAPTGTSARAGPLRAP